MSLSEALLPGPVSGPGGGALTPPQTRRLWWMYLLVVLALAAMGSGAAQAWVITHDGGASASSARCLLGHGVPDSEVAALAADPETGSMKALSVIISECVGPLDRPQAVAMVAGAVLVPAAAWLLMLTGGLGLRRRLRGRRRDLAEAAEGQAAAVRFEAWCDAWNLTGRRRPRLLLADPGRGTGTAFTTGLPLGRPVVVVPVAFAYGDQAAFDFVVLHELAHVRSRDLTWASSVWWAGWLSVPALLLAVSPLISRPSRLLSDYGSALVLAAVLSAALLVLRASLLRRREHAADQHAVVALGGTAPLAGALGQRSGGRRDGGRGRLRLAASEARSLVAVHPAPAARIGAVTEVLDRAEGGFAVTAAAGVLAMFGYQCLVTAVSYFRGGAAVSGVPARLLLAVPCLLWAWVVVPAWARRAAAAAAACSPAGWAGPVCGAVLGLVAGYCAQVPGTPIAVGPLAFSGHLPLIIAVLAIVTAGAGVLAAGAASLAGAAVGARPRWRALGVGGARPRWRALGVGGAVVTVGTALSVTLGVTPDVLSGHLAFHSLAEDRTFLGGEGNSWLWGWSFLIMAAGLAAAGPGLAAARGRLTLAADRITPRATWPVTVAAAVAGGAAAALSWQLRRRPHLPTDTAITMVDQRLWICALAGLAASAVILLTRRPPARRVGRAAGIPAALAAGFLTTVLAALTEFAAAWATGYNHDLAVFVYTLQESTWLLFIALVMTLPLLSAAAVAMTGAGHRQRPRYLLTALTATALTGALSLALLAGALSTITTAPHDQQQAELALSRVQADAGAAGGIPAIPVPRSVASGQNPGRLLRPSAARAALADVTELLPSGWKQVANGKPPTGIRPMSCQDQLNQATAPHTVAITRTYNFPVLGTFPTMSLTVSLTSNDKADQGFSANRKTAAACAHFTAPDSRTIDGLSYLSMTGGAKPSLPYPAYSVNITAYATGLVSGQPIAIDTTGPDDTVIIGHNEAEVTVLYSYYASGSPGLVRSYAERLAGEVLLKIISNLKARAGAPPHIA